MKTVLVTAIGSASSDAIISSLKGKVNLIGCDIFPKHCLTNVDDFNKFYNVPKAVNVEEYLNALFNIVKENNVDLLIPTTDIECDVLAPLKHEFLAKGVTLCCFDNSLQALCRNKYKLAKNLATNEICHTIPTYMQNEALPEEYPLILKPISGRSSQGQYIANNANELNALVNLRSDFIIQPFIKGNIYTVDVAQDKFGNIFSLVRKELLRTVNGLGTAIQTYKSHALNTVVENIANFIGFVGVANIEFIENNGKFYFLEINPRFSGGVGFSSLAGYDFVEAMLACHEGVEIKLDSDVADMYIAQSYVKKIIG